MEDLVQRIQKSVIPATQYAINFLNKSIGKPIQDVGQSPVGQYLQGNYDNVLPTVASDAVNFKSWLEKNPNNAAIALSKIQPPISSIDVVNPTGLIKPFTGANSLGVPIMRQNDINLLDKLNEIINNPKSTPTDLVNAHLQKLSLVGDYLPNKTALGKGAYPQLDQMANQTDSLTKPIK